MEFLRRGVAEADGNRTRQGQSLPLTGFEDRGTHQASVRLRGREAISDVKLQVTVTLNQ